MYDTREQICLGQECVLSRTFNYCRVAKVTQNVTPRPFSPVCVTPNPSEPREADS